MLISSSLFYLFSCFSLLSSICVITTKNPIFSVLFLILSFTNVSCLLFLFNLEFLPISFLVIYVGAIAVLFLFVLMMLNIKLSELQRNVTSFLPFVIFLGIVFIIEWFVFFRTEFVFLNLFDKSSIFFLSDILSASSSMNDIDFNTIFGLSSNIKTISVSLFSSYVFAFVLSGFVLLLAMVATIVLTVQKTFVSKTQNFYAQLMMDYNSSLISYK